MVKSEREYRNMMMEIREAAKAKRINKVVTGYASTFDEPYVFPAKVGLWEQQRRAFDETDVGRHYADDHEGRVFARTRNNTLRVEPDEKGLFIEADLGGTEIGRTVRRDRRRLHRQNEFSYGQSEAKNRTTPVSDLHEAHNEGGQTLRRERSFDSGQ